MLISSLKFHVSICLSISVTRLGYLKGFVDKFANTSSPKTWLVFGLFLKMSILKSKLPWPLFGSLLEKIWLLFLSTSGRTSFDGHSCE